MSDKTETCSLSIQQNSTDFSSRTRYMYILAPGLVEDAAYGRLPFDKYVMVHMTSLYKL